MLALTTGSASCDWAALDSFELRVRALRTGGQLLFSLKRCRERVRHLRAAEPFDDRASFRRQDSPFFAGCAGRLSLENWNQTIHESSAERQS